MTADKFFHGLQAWGFQAQRAIPGLDGLRAISILFVFFAHLTGTRNFPWTSPNTPLGVFGVRVFFVISGFLITSILRRELETTGRISLPRFYFRRTLRLFPACYFLIAAVAVAASWKSLELAPGDLMHAFTYTMNFHENRGWALGHLWTLAVEEQFYLLWPFALSRLLPARSVRLLFGVLAVAPVLRLASPYTGVALNFLVWSDALATGCLLGLLRHDFNRFPFLEKTLRSRWFAAVPVCAVLANYIPSTKVQWLFADPLMNIAIASCIEWAIRNPDGSVGRILNRPAVAFAGVLSYSLYLWQQLFLNRYSNSPLCAFPLNIVLVFLAALASYFLIEGPCLRFRSRFERVLLGARQETATLNSGNV